jgi:hypothetical protein
MTELPWWLCVCVCECMFLLCVLCMCVCECVRLHYAPCPRSDTCKHAQPPQAEGQATFTGWPF